MIKYKLVKGSASYRFAVICFVDTTKKKHMLLLNDHDPMHLWRVLLELEKHPENMLRELEMNHKVSEHLLPKYNDGFHPIDIDHLIVLMIDKNMLFEDDIDHLCKWLWTKLGDVPVDDDGIIDEDFAQWGNGTDREDIWHWFDLWYSKGVGQLQYDAVEEEADTNELLSEYEKKWEER